MSSKNDSVLTLRDFENSSLNHDSNDNQSLILFTLYFDEMLSYERKWFLKDIKTE